MKEKLLIVGAGGHARSVIDIALQDDGFEIIGCIDAQNPKRCFVEDMECVPIVGNDDDLAKFLDQGINHIFVALGDNKLRNMIYEKVIEMGFNPVNIISNYAVISPRARLGKGICVMAGAVINVNAHIGDNCIINTNCSIDHDCKIGKSVHVAPGVTLSGTVSVGDLTQIGTGASVIDGITIGEGSFIGAGSVVVKDIGSGVLAYGVPAKKIKDFVRLG